MESFNSLFRDWLGGNCAMVVPRRTHRHREDVLSRAASLFAMMPRRGSLHDVVDTERPRIDEACTRLPVRMWISPKETRRSREGLLALWDAHGLRPLGFHEVLDFVEAYREACARGLRPYPYTFQLAGTAACARSPGLLRGDEGRPVVLLCRPVSEDYVLVFDWEDMHDPEDDVVLLAPKAFLPEDVAAPEGVAADESFLMRAPRHWDPDPDPSYYPPA